MTLDGAGAGFRDASVLVLSSTLFHINASEVDEPSKESILNSDIRDASLGSIFI
jgi:hypothetical protein